MNSRKNFTTAENIAAGAIFATKKKKSRKRRRPDGDGEATEDTKSTTTSLMGHPDPVLSLAIRTKTSQVPPPSPDPLEGTLPMLTNESRLGANHVNHHNIYHATNSRDLLSSKSNSNSNGNSNNGSTSSGASGVSRRKDKAVLLRLLVEESVRSERATNEERSDDY